MENQGAGLFMLAAPASRWATAASILLMTSHPFSLLLQPKAKDDLIIIPLERVSSYCIELEFSGLGSAARSRASRFTEVCIKAASALPGIL